MTFDLPRYLAYHLYIHWHHGTHVNNEMKIGKIIITEMPLSLGKKNRKLFFSAINDQGFLWPQIGLLLKTGMGPSVMPLLFSKKFFNAEKIASQDMNLTQLCTKYHST